jgi:hypothetical protein
VLTVSLALEIVVRFTVRAFSFIPARIPKEWAVLAWFAPGLAPRTLVSNCSFPVEVVSLPPREVARGNHEHVRSDCLDKAYILSENVLRDGLVILSVKASENSPSDTSIVKFPS